METIATFGGDCDGRVWQAVPNWIMVRQRGRMDRLVKLEPGVGCLGVTSA